MDTPNTATVQIPEIRLAKVGDKRERKRGGLGWLSGGRGAGSAFSGAAGGSGAAAAGGMTLGKMLVAVLVAAVFGSGAWQVGKMMGGASDDSSPASKKVFADNGSQHYDDTSNVIKADNSIPNSMGYVSGSLDTRTPEEIAKQKADEEAARKADEDAKKKAEEDANKQPDAPAAAPVDPATIGTAETKLHPGKFGSLGSTTGGGLSGGSGLAGGINRNFGGVAGLGSKIVKPQNSGLTAFRSPSRPSMSRSGSAMNKGRSKGFAKSQLMNAFTQSRQANAAGKTETAAATSASAFDNNAGQGNVIDGPGVGAGLQTGAASEAPATNTGGPLGNTSSSPCGNGQYADSNGVCQNINGNNHSKNAAKYQWMIDTVEMLLAALVVIGLIAMLLQGPLETYKTALRVIVGLIGAAIMALGVMIMAAGGDKMMSGIITLIGAFTAATACWPDKLGIGKDAIVQIAAGPMIAGAIGSLAAANMKQPAAMQ